MKIGIIRETKTPADSRVCLPPSHCEELVKRYDNLDIIVQPSKTRCYTDEEYAEAGFTLKEDLNDCDILLGVKEVKIDTLIPNKTYFFFSHTIKEQAYNRTLLREVLQKKIQLVDYETLTDVNGHRVIAFGRWAGIVGAHNGILTWGKRTKRFDLPRLYKSFDFATAKSSYENIDLSDLKIVLTGTGRVSNGAKEVLDEMNIKQLDPIDFLQYEGKQAVYCMLPTNLLYAKNTDGTFSGTFYENPSGYHSTIGVYLKKANLLINGIYWDNRAPALFTKEDMKNDDFNVKVIADITCDIAPVSSIPSTLRASTIQDPIFAYDPNTEKETKAHKSHAVDMMTVDNLPNELARDASADFGSQFVKWVVPELYTNNTNMIYRASITTKDGVLNEPFMYLKDYVNS